VDLCFDLQLVFQEAHARHSVVDLRQQSFHILHCDAETHKQERGGKAETFRNQQVALYGFMSGFYTSWLSVRTPVKFSLFKL